MSVTEVDVLVLGAGAAGLAAALTATAAGADVLVVEIASPEHHTPNVRMSGGWVMTFTDQDGGARYLRACAGGLVAADRTDAWARDAADLERWLRGIGVDLVDDGETRAAEHPRLPGAGSIQIRRAATTLSSPVRGQKGWWAEDRPARGGEAIYRGLLHAVADVPIRWGTAARTLLRTPDGTGTGRVCGVVLADGGEILARRGVVVATGGFGASAELVRNHLAVPNTRFYGNPRNDGAGLRLAVSAGAGIARMNRFVGRGIASFPTGHGELGFMLDLAGGGYVICDQRGRRYTDEHPQAALHHAFYYEMQHYDTALDAYVRSPSYYLFDERRMRAGPLSYPDRGVCGVGMYEWSRDNAAELGAGWIGTGVTPAQAAAAVGAAPSAAFDEAVDDYNRGCAAGADRFGRPAGSLVPLDRPPYYCVPLFVGGPHTTGGPERDADGRVLAALDGRPIPGLFGAGELGQAVGLLYPAAGAALSEALTSGRQVGRTFGR